MSERLATAKRENHALRQRTAELRPAPDLSPRGRSHGSTSRSSSHGGGPFGQG